MTTDDINTDILAYIKYSQDFADQLLIDGGEFFPFAAQIDNDGTFSGIGFYNGDDRLCGSGKSIFLKKINGKWKIVDKWRTWIS